jgi:hypothetical protein
VIERVRDRRLLQVDAAKQLGLTPRHISRLVDACERDGPVALVSGQIVVEDFHGIREIEPVLAPIRLALGLVPREVDIHPAERRGPDISTLTERL